MQCSDFVAYVHRTALIASIFPEGLPEDILVAMKEIECFKIKESVKKVEAIPFALLDRLKSLIAGKISGEALQQLCTSIKGEGISFFTQTALAHPEMWNFAGFICMVDKEPSLIDYGTYSALTNSSVGHSIEVTQEELDAVMAIKVRSVR